MKILGRHHQWIITMGVVIIWRVSEAHNIMFYDVDTPWMVS